MATFAKQNKRIITYLSTFEKINNLKTFSVSIQREQYIGIWNPRYTAGMEKKQLPHKNVVLHIKLPHKSVLITLKVPHKNVLIFGNVMIITYFCRQITKSTIEWKEK